MAYINGKPTLFSPIVNITKRYYSKALGTPGLEYATNDGWNTAYCVGIGTAIDANIIIPKEFNGATVISIEAEAFKGCDKIKSIEIPETITTIGASAFEGCTAVEKIYYNAVTAKDFAENCSPFKYCGMDSPTGTAITIGKSVVKVPKSLFDTNNAGMLIPNNNFTSLRFEEGTACWQLRSFAFRGCTNLVDIEIADSVTEFQGHTFRGVGAKAIVFGENSKLYNVGACTFKASKLESITLPATVGRIPNEAFSYCENLKTVTFKGIPAESIFQTAFLGCTALRSIRFEKWTGENADNLQSLAPWGASGVSVSYGGTPILYGTAGLEYTLSDDETYYSVSGIGTATDTYIVIPSTYNGKTVQEIGKRCFANNFDITEVVIEEGVSFIRDEAFLNCQKIKEITLGDIGLIGTDAFRYCYNLYEIHIPPNCDIGNRAFAYDRELRSIYFDGIPNSIANDAFKSIFGWATFYMPWSEGEVEGHPWGATNTNTKFKYNYNG